MAKRKSKNSSDMMSSAIGMSMMGGTMGAVGGMGVAGAHPGHAPGSFNIGAQIAAMPLATRKKFFKDY